MAMWAGVVFWITSLSLAAGGRQNVARGKPAWMSTRQRHSYPAAKAVDGVTTTSGMRNLVHTAEDEPTAWWKVDLQTQVQSPEVNIYFRTDYKYRRNGLQLYTSKTNSSDPKEGDLCDTVRGRSDGTDISDVLDVTCPGTWRYLTVYTDTDNNGQGPVLDFSEVQVWSGRQNVARGKPAWMSTRYTQSYPAAKAVDGVTKALGVWNLAHTAEDEPTAWWKVDLQTQVQSPEVKIYFRTDYKFRRNGLELYTSKTNSSDPKEGDLCDTVRGRSDGTDISDVLDVTCPGTWRYLTVYTDTDNNGQGPVLDFSEVQVWKLTVTPVTPGMIGLAAGICLVVLGVLLFVLVRKRRLQWINSPQMEEINVRATSNAVDSTQPSDNIASIYEEAIGRNIYRNDYSTLDVEAKLNNDYDVIKNMVYENM